MQLEYAEENHRNLTTPKLVIKRPYRHFRRSHMSQVDPKGPLNICNRLKDPKSSVPTTGRNQKPINLSHLSRSSKVKEKVKKNFPFFWTKNVLALEPQSDLEYQSVNLKSRGLS